MGALARTKLSTRIQLLVGLTLIGLLVLCVTALFQLKETMLDDRKEKVHNIVEVGLGIITHHHKLAAEGKMGEPKPRRLPAMRCAACASPPATTTSASTPTGSITCMVATPPWKDKPSWT